MPPDRATLTVLVGALLVASATFAVAGQVETQAGNDSQPTDETPETEENMTTEPGDATDDDGASEPGDNMTEEGDEPITTGENDTAGEGDNVTEEEGNVTEEEGNVSEEPGTAAMDRGKLTLSSLSAPETASPGETVTVQAVIENTGDEHVTESVEFRLGGQVLDRQSVSLAPNEQQTVTFEANTSGLDTGEYTHGVFTEQDGLLATLNVTEPFTVEELSAPESATSGENITVEATVTNPGDMNATERVTYRFSGGTIAEENVTLDPGESETITENVTLDGVANGTYTHGVLARDNGQLAEIEVTDGNVSTAGAEVSFSEQESDGSFVVVDEVTVPNGGFVAIHNQSLLMGDVTGSVVGVSEKLEPGTHENVVVHLYDFPGSPDAEGLEEEELLIAMPHLDDNGNGLYDFVRSDAETDGPYLADGSVVVDSANMSINESMSGPPTEMPGDGAPGDETPGEGVGEPGDGDGVGGPDDGTPEEETTPGDNETTEAGETMEEGAPSDETPSSGDTGSGPQEPVATDTPEDTNGTNETDSTATPV